MEIGPLQYQIFSIGLILKKFRDRPTLILFMWRYSWWSNTFVQVLYGEPVSELGKKLGVTIPGFRD